MDFVCNFGRVIERIKCAERMNLEDGLRPGGADCKGIRRGVKRKKKIRCTDMSVTFSLKCCPSAFCVSRGGFLPTSHPRHWKNYCQWDLQFHHHHHPSYLH